MDIFEHFFSLRFGLPLTQKRCFGSLIMKCFLENTLKGEKNPSIFTVFLRTGKIYVFENTDITFVTDLRHVMNVLALCF